jgi:PAS domain-containing protein
MNGDQMVKPKIQEVFEEKFWKGLLNIFPQSFILLDMKGNLIIHNLNSSGIPWLSEVHLDLVLHKNCQEDPCELQEYLRGAVDSFQQKIPVEDDRILLSRAFTYSFKGKSYCFLLLQDITESKSNETIMKFNERRMRAIIDASPQCFLTVDSRGNVLSVQSRGDGSLPLTESLVGKKVTQILPFQRPKAIANALVQVREGNGLKIINENWLKGD